MPLRRRLLISSLLGSIPLIILGLLLSFDRYYSLRNLILSTNLENARLTAAYTQGWLEGQVRTLRTIALSAEVQSGNKIEERALLFRQLDAQPDWDSMWISNAQGKVIVDTEEGAVDISEEEYVHEIKSTGQPYISGLMQGRVTGNSIVVIAYPIQHNGVFVGSVAIGIRRNAIQKIFTQVSIGDRTTISLWGSNNSLIARSAMTDTMLRKTYSTREMPYPRANQSGTAITESLVTHDRVLIGYAPVQVAHWTVISAAPMWEALAPVTHMVVIFLLISTLVLASTLAWSYYSAKVLADQVIALADGARAIGSGNLATRINMHSGGELGDLANSLNSMATDLQINDRLKSEFLSLISHELKTPLTSIRAALDLLESGMVTEDHPRYHELTDIALRQAKRLQDMIDNLLSVARIDTGGLTVVPRETLLYTFLTPAIEQCRELATARGLTLTLDAPENMRMLVDSPKVLLALKNLLENAVKFTESGGITVRVQRQGAYALISITDTGAGMDGETKQRLFEKFFQAEPLLTRKAGGAGLGLYVTKFIIEAHGGAITTESKGSGYGSTFSFTLPLAHPEMPPSIATGDQPSVTSDQ